MVLPSGDTVDLTERTRAWAAVGVAFDLEKIRRTAGRSYEAGDHRCRRCKLKCATRTGAIRITRGRKRSYLCAACARLPFPSGWIRAED